ncbi:MAG: porin family protein [Acidobacteria bacterium]|nr:MAG: porin family protein [Acidobacteriota bacterium]
MTNKLTLTVAVAATLALAVPAYAQSSGQTNSGAVIAVQGGGLTTVTNLNDADTADFKTGFNVGGALGYRFNPNLALRGTYTFGRSESRGTALPAAITAGTKTNRQFYGAELQLSAPVAGGISPYLLAGAGAVTIKPDTTPSQASFTKPAGKAGVGISFEIPASNVSVFAEGTGWFYKFDQYGFDKTQFDLAWSAGLSYRFGK